MKVEQGLRKVEYFGNVLMIPEGNGWIAVDSDGELFWFDEGNEPEIYEDDGCWFQGIESRIFGQVDLEGVDWRETLMRVEGGKL